MVIHSISDLLIRLKNAGSARQRVVVVPVSKVVIAVLGILEQEGYVTTFEKKESELRVHLEYKRRKPVLSEVKIWSRPGVRFYRRKNELPRPLGGLGISIVSTSFGMMTGSEANKRGLGGELLAEVW